MCGILAGGGSLLSRGCAQQQQPAGATRPYGRRPAGHQLLMSCVPARSISPVTAHSSRALCCYNASSPIHARCAALARIAVAELAAGRLRALRCWRRERDDDDDEREIRSIERRQRHTAAVSEAGRARDDRPGPAYACQ
jgi:hypothetical protein